MKNRIFLLVPLVLLFLTLSLQSCEEERVVTEGMNQETVKDPSQVYNMYSDQFIPATPEDKSASNSFSSFSSVGLANKEGKILSKIIDTKLSALGSHWQKHKAVFSAFKKGQFNFYTYDNGMELLVIETSVDGGKDRLFFICPNNSNEKGNDDPPVIRVNCKGHCVEEIQDCTEMANVLTGIVVCTCQSDDCYMEFTRL